MSSSFNSDREEVVKRAVENNVKIMISVGTGIDSCRKNIELAETHSQIYAVIGIHPHNAKDVDENTYSILEKLAHNKRVVGYGEIGLDFYRMRSPKMTQIRRFSEQIEVAKRLELPIVIHDRDAHQEVYDLLKNSEATGVIHCFSGDHELAREFIDIGFYISIPTTVTYEKNRRLHQVVKKTPIDRIIVETDAPALSPINHARERNEPSFVKYAVEKVAELREISIIDAAKQLSRNTRKLFKI
jgi:TatD DNase family protein